MGTPSLAPGQRGEVHTVGQKRDASQKWKNTTRGQKAERWRSRVYFRATDGITRELSRTGRTKAEAEQAIDQAFAEATSGTVEMTANMPLLAAGALWLDHVSLPAAGLAARTVSDYRATFRRYFESTTSPVRGLSLGEVNNPQRIRGFLQSVADRHGTAAAQVARSVLVGILGLAVNNGVLAASAARQVGKVQASTRKAPTRKVGVARDTSRAFTKEERDAVVALADELAAEENLMSRTSRKRQTTADLAAFLAGTGCRITEARRLVWADVDLARGRAEIRGTKSRTSHRMVTLPEWLAVRMRERAERVGTDGFTFAAPHHVGDGAGMVEWDQSNCASAMAQLLEAAGHAWATPHSFRRTVATLAGEAGAPLVDIADQLGHSDPAMTARVYLGRDPFGERANVARYL